MDFSAFLIIAGLIFCLFLLNRRPPPPDHPGKETPAKPAKENQTQPIQTAPPQRQAPHRPVPAKEVDHAPPPDIPTSRELRGKAYVIDGDTIVVSKIKIRLAGIDAPELDQPWGQKSKWEMVRICKGQVIKVELTGETSYDRLVGTCYLPDGRDIGAEIIKAGLVLDGGHFSKGKYRSLEPPGVRNRLKHYGRWR